MAEAGEPVRTRPLAPRRQLALRFDHWHAGGVPPWHLFVLVLLLQATLVMVVPGSELFGDESRYLHFADNILDGYYTSADDPDLTNGPGYPLVLAPLVAVDAPLTMMRLANAFWLAAAAAILYRALRLVASYRAALVGALGMALYPPSLYWGTYLYSEAFSVFLMSAFLFTLVRVLQSPGAPARRLILSGAVLSALALTKTIFAFVAVGMAVASIGILLTRRRESARRASLVFGAAVLFLVPYLAYAYSLTGNAFQLTTNGGELLYWMASPFDNEVGSWISPEDVKEIEEVNEFHRSFHAGLVQLSEVERDEAFRKQAAEFLRANPGGYLGNLPPNVIRLFFNIPYTARPVSAGAIGYAVPSLILLGAGGLAARRVRRNRRHGATAANYALGLAATFVGLSVLVPTAGRYLIVAVPALILWISSVLTPASAAHSMDSSPSGGNQLRYAKS